MSFDFRPHRPEGALGRYVATIWFAHGTIGYAREHIAPTGSTVAIWILGDPIRQTAGGSEPVVGVRGLVAGPHDRPLTNEPLGVTHALGVVTTAIGGKAALGLEPRTWRGRVGTLEEALPEGVALHDRLLTLTDPHEQLAAVEAWLEARLEPADAKLERAARAVAMLEAEPHRPIAEIAATLGVSHGHLDRQLSRIVGLTPRRLASILRMRRLLSAIDVHSDVDWSRWAADLGWFDQAHMIRDFRRFTGVTPTAYVDAQRRTYSPEEADVAAGFVPES